MMTERSIMILLQFGRQLQELQSQLRMQGDDFAFIFRKRTIVIIHHRDDGVLAYIVIHSSTMDIVYEFLLIPFYIRFTFASQQPLQHCRLILQDSPHQCFCNLRHMDRMGIGGDLRSHAERIQKTNPLLRFQILGDAVVEHQGIHIADI